VVPLARDLYKALATWQAASKRTAPADRVIPSERGASLSANSVRNWFAELYWDLGFEGCSSHSGRRTFITGAAKKIIQAGGSLRDVQELAGHSSLQTTQRYIQGDSEARRRVIDLL
jgi:integrase/recombinase XerD